MAKLTDLLQLFVLALLVAVSTGSASATPIYYLFTGTASGTLNGNSFSNKLLTVIATGNTDDVTFDDGNSTYFNNTLSTTITIAGIGTMTVTPGGSNYDYVFDNPAPEPYGPRIGYGVKGIPNCCDIIQFANAAYQTYNLQGSIGPLSSPSDLSTADWVNVPTSMGDLTVTSYTGNMFTAGGTSITQTLQPGVTAIYPAGNDNSKWTPFNNKGGELLTITAVPILRSAFDANPPTAFPGESCVPYADFSAANGGQDTCVEFQADCVDTATSNDCATFLYQVTTNYYLPDSLLLDGVPQVGGPDFLVVHGVGCPQTSLFDHSIFLEYGVSRTDPHTTAGGSGLSCYVATFHPTGFSPITSGTTSTFVGFKSPVSNTALNIVKAGSTVPLIWLQLDTSGNPVINLTLCSNTSCPTGGTNPPPPPWVNIQAYIVSGALCTADQSSGTDTLSSLAAGNSGLQNLGNGNYQYNWKTPAGTPKGTCAEIVFTYSSGAVLVTPPEFQFK